MFHINISFHNCSKMKDESDSEIVKLILNLFFFQFKGKADKVLIRFVT
jgi:hypothetical protein